MLFNFYNNSYILEWRWWFPFMDKETEDFGSLKTYSKLQRKKVGKLQFKSEIVFFWRLCSLENLFQPKDLKALGKICWCCLWSTLPSLFFSFMLPHFFSNYFPKWDFPFCLFFSSFLCFYRTSEIDHLLYRTSSISIIFQISLIEVTKLITEDYVQFTMVYPELFFLKERVWV
jgi:hypothetical protein